MQGAGAGDHTAWAAQGGFWGSPSSWPVQLHSRTQGRVPKPRWGQALGWEVAPGVASLQSISHRVPWAGSALVWGRVASVCRVLGWCPGRAVTPPPLLPSAPRAPRPQGQAEECSKQPAWCLGAFSPRSRDP